MENTKESTIEIRLRDDNYVKTNTVIKALQEAALLYNEEYTDHSLSITLTEPQQQRGRGDVYRSVGTVSLLVPNPEEQD